MWYHGIYVGSNLGETLLCDTFLPGDALGEGEGDARGVDRVGVLGDGVLLDEDAAWTVNVLGLLGAGDDDCRPPLDGAGDDVWRPLLDGLLDLVLGLLGTERVFLGEAALEETVVLGDEGLDDAGVPLHTLRLLPPQQSSSSLSSETNIIINMCHETELFKQ